MSSKPQITSSELGSLWLTYQEKTMYLRMLEYFIEKADDETTKEIMTNLHQEFSTYVEKITDTLRQEGAVIPIGYTEEDVNKEVPKLYDNGFDIMFIRLLNEISMGLHALNITMVFREDIVMLFKELTEIAQRYYNICTQYLLEKGLLVKSPYVSMPKSVQFAKDTSYLGGLSINPFSEKRSLNTVEVAHIHHAIESNLLGFQLMTGFAQCAKEEDIINYFDEGASLARSIVKKLSDILLQSSIQTPQTAGGNVTHSTLAPFSEKLMMYCTSLLCSFSMGSGSLGTAFSLRNDLPANMSVFLKDIFEYAHKGAKLMIKKGWLEEPPQMSE
ncbi:DUF3231 family protein [Bacillus sinesaloumensis]|uniref:DUF3231 family protein n=1 Tax=Litchfieldia sinesaloumensis TaxID=1926280 RepID=UPI0009887A73|nr:DUF3231 family protein [Bacillus sinesaloumensis]